MACWTDRSGSSNGLKRVTNSCQPSLDMLIKIAKVLNVDLNELVRFDEVSIDSE